MLLFINNNNNNNLKGVKRKKIKRKKEKSFSPKTGPSVHQIKHLSRIEELFETSQELDALVIARFRIDKDQERRTALRPHSLPSFVRA